MFLWDYNRKELEKSKSGRLLILERLINYGPGKEKIDLSEVKKNWDKLHLFSLQKKLLELLIWGKYSSQPKSNKLFWTK